MWVNSTAWPVAPSGYVANTSSLFLNPGFTFIINGGTIVISTSSAFDLSSGSNYGNNLSFSYILVTALYGIYGDESKLTYNVYEWDTSSTLIPGFFATGAITGNTNYGYSFIITLHDSAQYAPNALSALLHIIENRGTVFLRSVYGLLANMWDPSLTVAAQRINPSRNEFATYTAQSAMQLLATTVSNYMGDERLLNWAANYNTAATALLEESRYVFSPGRTFSHSPYEHSSKSAFLDNKANRTSASTGYEKKSSLRFAPMGENTHRGVWSSALSEFSYQNPQEGDPGFNTITAGGLLGYDYFLSRKAQGGISFAYLYNTVHNQDCQGKSFINMYAASLYGQMCFKYGFFEGQLWATANQTETQRNISFLGYSGTTKSRYVSGSLTPHIGGGVDLNFDWGRIEPFVMLDYVLTFQPAYDEHGTNAFDYEVKKKFASMLISQAGIVCYQTHYKKIGLLIVKEGLSYQNVAPFNTGKITAGLSGATGTITVETLTRVQNFIVPLFEIDFIFNNNWSLSLLYQGFYGVQSVTNEGLFRIGKYF